MIRLDGASKSFRIAPRPGRRAGVIEAVRAVTTTVEAGTITGVVGPNGAGKTTLFGLLLGFLEPSSGSITIAGRAPRAYLRHFGAGYLPERFQLPREWTARAALRALLELDDAVARLDEWLEQFELQPFADMYAGKLSRGTLQRLGIAQALAAARRLIVLDEPTEGLDPIWRVRFREQVTSLRSADRTILIASHDLAEIERLADRVIILRDGRITETVDLRPRGEQPRDYTIVLAEPHVGLKESFPGARTVGISTFTVTVANASDLNARLAALIDAGAVVISLQPASGIEERVVRGPAETP